MSERRVSGSSIVFGLLFIVLGIMFMLEELDYWEFDALLVLPILLIGLGLAVIFGSRSTPG